MRTITAAQSAVLASGVRSEHCRVLVKDAGGNWRDLTSYPGFNAVKSVRLKDEPDATGASADITLNRAHGTLSLAPLLSGSALNVGFTPGGTYAPLVYLGREVKVDLAIVPACSAPVSGDWMTVFHGRIDTIDSGGPSSVTLGARDLSGKLADTWFTSERVYAYGEASGLPVSMSPWKPGETYAVGACVFPTETKVNDFPYFYVATSITTGISGATEPTWPGASTVVDGGVTWSYVANLQPDGGYPVEQVIQNMLDDCLGAGAVTLYVPSSPLFELRPLQQNRDSLLTAIRNAALSFGGDVRYQWRSGTNQFELTLVVVNRSPGATARTFSASEWRELPKVAFDIQGLRNWVDVIYSDSETPADPAGNHPRKRATKKNTTSISALYKLWMEIAEDSASLIDTAAEAEAMAQAAVDDLSTPDVDLSVELAAGFPWVELRDFYKFSADGDHFDADQSLAVHSYEHTYEDGHLRTTLNCRGKPSAGRDRWHAASTHPSTANLKPPTHKLDLFNTAGGTTLTIESTIGGARFKIDATQPVKESRIEEFEYHAAASNALPPSASTLLGTSASKAAVFGHMQPGGSYYGSIVPVVRNASRVVRGQPSAWVPFSAGRAQATHLQPGLDTSRLPLNGAFETRFDGAALPDGWSGGGWSVREDTGGSSGTRYIRLNGADAPQGLTSELCPVREGSWYRLSAWVKGYSGSANFSLKATWLERSQSQGDLVASTAATFAANAYGSWSRVSAVLQAPTGARFARVTILPANTSSGSAIDIDEVRLEPCADDWNSPGSLLNSWAAYDAVNFPLGFCRYPDGTVELRGLAKDGTPGVSSVIFTLPVGYRPSTKRAFAVMSNGVGAHCQVATNGDVVAENGSGTWFSLDGVRFRASGF